MRIRTAAQLLLLTASIVCLVLGFAGPPWASYLANLALALPLGAWIFVVGFRRSYQLCSTCGRSRDFHFLSFLRSGHLFDPADDHREAIDIRRSLAARLVAILVLAALLSIRFKAAPIGVILVGCLIFSLVALALVAFFGASPGRSIERSILLRLEGIAEFPSFVVVLAAVGA